jgi:tetratricopeptide (TPR) repeat protein
MNTCFVLMPFSSEFKNQWDFAFVPAIESVNLRAFRGDEEALGTNMIMKDITQSIYDAQIIVADLTGRNPNVMYELGLAHAAKKPVIMLVQSDDDIPFDIKHIRYLPYNDKDLNKLRSDLASRSRNTLSQRNSDSVDFFPQLRVMSNEVFAELAYLRQKTLKIDIEVHPSTADIFLNDKLLEPGTRTIRINTAAERNTISASDIEHLDYHETISKDNIDAGKILISLDRRDKDIAERLAQLLRRVPRWLRYRRYDPYNPVLMRAICQYLEMDGDMDEARVEAKHLVETCPNWWLAHYQVGAICVTEGQYAEAIPYFSRAVTLRGDKAAGYLALACMYSRTHQYKEAIAQLAIVESSDELVDSYGRLEVWNILDDDDFNNIKEDQEYKNHFLSVVQNIEAKAHKKKIPPTSSVGG